VVDDLVGAVLLPTDGTVNPGDAVLAFAKGASDRGARYVPTPSLSLNRSRFLGHVPDLADHAAAFDQAIPRIVRHHGVTFLDPPLSLQASVHYLESGPCLRTGCSRQDTKAPAATEEPYRPRPI